MARFQKPQIASFQLKADEVELYTAGLQNISALLYSANEVELLRGMTSRYSAANLQIGALSPPTSVKKIDVPAFSGTRRMNLQNCFVYTLWLWFLTRTKI